MDSVKKSLLFSFSQKYSEILVGFVSTLILARLLTPEEVGIYSVIATITVVAHMVRDFGVSNYIVQERELTDEKVISAFLVTFFWSYTIGLSLFCFSMPIANFFERSELQSVVLVSSLGFAFIPFGSVSLNLLRKDMQFKKLFFINVSSVVVSSILSITLAYLGFSYMSLAWGSLSGIVTIVVLSSFFRQRVKIAIPRWSVITSVFSFGTKSSYISVISMLVNQLPEILIAKFHGMINVGLYSRANGLIKIFNMGVLQGIFPVLLPHLVNKLKSGSDIKEDFLQTIEFITTLAWPFFLFLSFFSTEIIQFLFGEQWVGASPILNFLCVAAAAAAVYSFNSQVLISKGLINLDVKTQTISQVFSASFLLMGAFLGFKFILMALILSRFFTLSLSFHYCLKALGIKVSELLVVLTKPVVVTGVCFLCIEMLSAAMAVALSGLVYLLACSAVYTLVWLASIYTVRSKLFDIICGLLPFKRL